MSETAKISFSAEILMAIPIIRGNPAPWKVSMGILAGMVGM